MFFKTFTTTCFAITLTSSAVQASSAVTQEDAMPTATKEFLSQTMTEGESGGLFGPSKISIWKFTEEGYGNQRALFTRSSDSGAITDSEKIKLIADWGGVETDAYTKVNKGTQASVDDVIATVDKAQQKWASDRMQSLAREIKYIVKDTDCAEAAAATTEEQRQTFTEKFVSKLLPNLISNLEPFRSLDHGPNDDKIVTPPNLFDQFKAATNGVARWNDKPAQFEKVASLKQMRSALVSTDTIMFVSGRKRGHIARETTGVNMTDMASYNRWYAEATFLARLETVCNAEYQAWGSPDMSFFKTPRE